jgi:hypothetical protein
METGTQVAPSARPVFSGRRYYATLMPMMVRIPEEAA